MISTISNVEGMSTLECTKYILSQLLWVFCSKTITASMGWSICCFHIRPFANNQRHKKWLIYQPVISFTIHHIHSLVWKRRSSFISLFIILCWRTNVLYTSYNLSLIKPLKWPKNPKLSCRKTLLNPQLLKVFRKKDHKLK